MLAEFLLPVAIVIYADLNIVTSFSSQTGDLAGIVTGLADILKTLTGIRVDVPGVFKATTLGHTEIRDEPFSAG